MTSKEIISHSENETMELACKLVSFLPSGTVLILTGDLGAGKTTFTRGLAKGLHINDVVQSPTFNIMKPYFGGDRVLVHIDAYRLENIDQDIGLDEYIGYEKGITVIEWPQYIEKLIPDSKVEINFSFIDDSVRKIIIKSELDFLRGVSL